MKYNSIKRNYIKIQSIKIELFKDINFYKKLILILKIYVIHLN